MEKLEVELLQNLKAIRSSINGEMAYKRIATKFVNEKDKEKDFTKTAIE